MTPPPPAWIARILEALAHAQASGISGDLTVRWELKRGHLVRLVIQPPPVVVDAAHDPLDGGGTLTPAT